MNIESANAKWYSKFVAAFYAEFRYGFHCEKEIFILLGLLVPLATIALLM